MTDFLFHEVSESEKEEIKKEAKSIMDSFSKKLEKVKDKISEPFVEREDFEREEITVSKSPAAISSTTNPKERDEEVEDFRRLMFENAPNKNADFIIAEKKSWK